MDRHYRGYFAVKLTALQEPGVRAAYWSLYESIADKLGEIDAFALHAPHRLTDPHALIADELSPRDVYLLDRLHVTHADVIVACIELPSFGVGAELQMASDHGIPIVSFYYEQADREPSRLIRGMPGVGETSAEAPSRLVRYMPSVEGQSGLPARLIDAVGRVLAARGAVRNQRRWGTAAALENCRRKSQVSRGDLALKAGLTLENVDLLALAGEPFQQWLAKPQIRDRVSLDLNEIDEDLVLLPAFDAVLRVMSALEVPLEDVGRVLGIG